MKCEAFTSTALPEATCSRTSARAAAPSATIAMRSAGMPAPLRAGRDALGKLPDAHEAVKAAFGGEGAHFLVKLRGRTSRARPCRRAPRCASGDIERGEGGKRRAHGIGVRIVGVVDDGEAAGASMTSLAARLGLGARKRRRNLRGLHAGGESQRRRRQALDTLCMPRSSRAHSTRTGSGIPSNPQAHSAKRGQPDASRRTSSDPRRDRAASAAERAARRSAAWRCHRRART